MRIFTKRSAGKGSLIFTKLLRVADPRSVPTSGPGQQREFLIGWRSRKLRSFWNLRFSFPCSALTSVAIHNGFEVF
jgi:hypothetical protein